MLYAIMGEDAPGSLARRRETRPAHLARVEQLKAQGRLVIAGPHPAIDAPDPGPGGFTGSLIVAEFDSLEQATRYYLALKRNGVDAELLVFPGEDHELTRGGRPRHRVERFRAILDWWQRRLPATA